MSIVRTTVLVLAISALALVQAAPEAGINFINMFIRLEDERAYGLHKLNATERSRLNEVFGRIVAEKEDHLRNSALAYLRREGWDAFEVTGSEQLTLDQNAGPKTYLSARWRDARLTLEPVSRSTLMPGHYLGRIDSTFCRILDPEGRPVEFLIRRTGLPGTGN